MTIKHVPLVWSPGSTTTSYDSDTSPDRNNKTKKVWSPGSSSICSDAVAQSKSDRKKIQTTAISTQTTPEKRPQPISMTSNTLPKGFRSVKPLQVPREEQTSTKTTAPAAGASVAATSVTGVKQDEAGDQPRQQNQQQEANGLSGEEAASPSSMSEISIETANGGSKSLLNQRQTDDDNNVNAYSPPSSMRLKYWTLPRNISSGRQRQQTDDEQEVDDGERDVMRKSTAAAADSHKVESSAFQQQQQHPHSSKFLYETPSSNKYFTLPNPTSVPAASSSSSSPHHSNHHHQQRPSSAYSVPAGAGTYDGIGPLSEQGLSGRPEVPEGHGPDWYKTMFNRLHKYEARRRGQEEPVRIKYKTRRPKGESVSTNRTGQAVDKGVGADAGPFTFPVRGGESPLAKDCCCPSC